MFRGSQTNQRTVQDLLGSTIMFRRISYPPILALLLLFISAHAEAQNSEADQKAYCVYLAEQAKAQSNFLRSPDALAGFTQPETGLPMQLVVGTQISLSNLKKAGITLDAARKNCELYKASTGVLLALQYALPAVEKDALTHRLLLIEEASKSLDALIDKTSQMVAAQNMTRPMLVSLLSNRIKLDSDRAETQSKIAALYIPQLSDQPLKLQVAAKQSSDHAEQSSLARLIRQNNWDVTLTVGAHQQLNPVANGFGPYGEVSATYNLGSRAIDKHLDRSVDAYSSWKKVQENDVERGMEVLQDQVQQTIAVQENRIKSIQQESEEIETNLKLVGDADTSAALDFRNQLISTQLLIGIETGDASYRLDRLKDFVSRNF
ncbi:MAG: hypothetical protein ABR912_03775 [Terracidiphilus sp.]